MPVIDTLEQETLPWGPSELAPGQVWTPSLGQAKPREIVRFGNSAYLSAGRDRQAPVVVWKVPGAPVENVMRLSGFRAWLRDTEATCSC